MVRTADILHAATQALAKEGFSRAREDAEMIVSTVTGRTRTQLLTYPEAPIPPQQAATIWSWIQKRAAHHPIQYLRGLQEFYGREFEVNPDVLIPRPETEFLVDRCLELLAGKPHAKVLDLGTGSGCIAVTLACESSLLQITATDISEKALAIARRNASRLLPEPASIEFLAGDLIEPVHSRVAFYDLIVSNPPYVSQEETGSLPPTVSRFEPGEALFAGSTGLEIHARILNAAPPVLKSDGALVLEIGQGQSSLVVDLATQAGWTLTDSRVDLAGIERCLTFQLVDG